ncbi:MAG: hypothetical protein FWG80_04920 [Alphaproteobacteria bacterium]|nr:hypothetical protein [Alphaproteobacteria bacterium]
MNTFNKTIKLTSILAVLTIIPLHRSIAAVACIARPKPNSPTSCPPNGRTQCPANGPLGNSTNLDCANLSLGDWKLTNCTGSNVSEFSGTSMCSSTSGSNNQPGNPVADNGRYCWCKITSVPGFTVYSTRWVLRSSHAFQNVCTNSCALDCSEPAPSASPFRSALFMGVGL